MEHSQGGDAVVVTSVLVQIAGPGSAYRAAKQLADRIWSALYLPRVGGYLSIQPDSAAPNYLGPDALGRHAFSINVDFQWSSERVTLQSD